MKSNFDRKKIGNVSRQIYQPEYMLKQKKIINTPEYHTNGEYLLIVKDIEHSTIKLIWETTQSIKIKALTKVTIVPNNSSIDGKYLDMEIENGACVEFEYYQDTWYIVGSDGVKTE
jgi:hypothetical protein